MSTYSGPDPGPHPRTDLTVELRETGAASTLRIEGDLDMGSIDVLLEVAEPRCAKRESFVELDMSDVGFLDSAGLHALVRLHRLSEAATGRLILVDPPARVVRLLRLTGLDAVLRLA